MPSARFRPLLALVMTWAAAVSLAQSTPPLSGTWAGTTTSPSTGNTMQIEVVFQDTAAGTWRYRAPATAKRAGACFDRDFPLELRPVTDTTYTVSVDAARLVTGCPTFRLTLERVNDTTLEGQFADGRPARLVRQSP
jgi:hypothetical protein